MIISLITLILFSGCSNITVPTYPTDDEDNINISINSPVDLTTGAIETIDYAHHEIHEGSSYMISGEQILGNGATYTYIFDTNNMSGKWVHILLNVRGVGEGNAILYENITYVGGTPNGVKNRNRNYPNDNQLIVTEGATLLTSQVVVLEEHFGAGKNLGGENRNTDEIILRTNETYAYQITSETNSNDMSWIYNWYENTPKN